MAKSAGRFEHSGRPVLVRGRPEALCVQVMFVLLGACTLPGCGSGPEASGAEGQEANVVVGRAPAAVRGVPSVIILRPLSGATPPAAVDPVVMDQFTMSFAPTLLLAPVGRPMVFTNSEAISHNVTVRPMGSDLTLLNVDLDVEGRSELTLEEPGGYDVSCAVHPGMTAFVFATPSPYAMFAEADGSFAVSDVPPGSYALTVWSMTPENRSEPTVEVVSGTTELELGPGA